MRLPSALITVAIAGVHVYATTLPALSARQSITTLTTASIDAFTPYAQYASAAYCTLSSVQSWSCGSSGTNCDANPQFQLTAAGGDDSDTPDWYVGYDPTLNTIVVAHEGTNDESLLSLIDDGDIVLASLSSTLFPGAPSGVKVHQGFADTQASTATQVLAAVQTTLDNHAGASVTLVGHSLGAAIATIDAVYLPPQLPAGTDIRVVVFGLPRVGNQDWANYIQTFYPGSSTPPSSTTISPSSLVHINNKEDFIPILPGMFLGFVHPDGEIHIQDSNAWDACPGQDNDSDLCIVGDVPYIWDGDESDHDGPYNGVTMGDDC